ncbi:222_t:CDS:10 [Diversispora eburnea]|uniref:222_t:CDS:1 n=1 Tax=Diversispora eburnea TaxID=1213867 RepID=A0A9N9BNC9_9GLOM|nr:222_t:CDS:10 [Diversispora eburnea]
MKLAHEKYGKLPWKRLFMPSINISRNGFPVPAELSIRLMEIVLNNPILSSIYAPIDGKLLKEGETLYRTNYSITLEKIANNYTEFYKGSIAKSLIKTIQDAGGIMILEDLVNYHPVVRKPIIGYYNGRKIITTPEPASGVVLIFLLNLLEKYELHKIGFARRTEIGDSAFFENKTEHNLRILELISKEYADIVRRNLTDDETHNPNYYNPLYSEVNDHGTAHLSAIDNNDMAVSFTSTNMGFTSKKPLSSTIPTVIEKDGKLELVIGGSGGTKIISAVLQAFFESGFSFKLIENLLEIGHVIQMSNIHDRRFSAMVQAVRKFNNNTIHAVSDFRKLGKAAGY